MNDSNTDNEDKPSGSDKKTSDFVVGLVTFIIFLFFMTAWMYFSS